MAEQVLPIKLIARNDTAANWMAANPVLLRGEPGVETDTGKMKYGDGVKAWDALPYSLPRAADVLLAPVDGMAATTVQEAVAENFRSVVDGKKLLEAAVSDKGGTVDKAGNVATFAELKEGITSITGGSGECTITFENYNPSGGAQKETYESLSQARYSLEATTVGSTALFIGGYVKSGSSTTKSTSIDAYSVDGVRRAFTSLTSSMSSFAVTAVGGLAVIAGGNISAAVASVSAYSEAGVVSSFPALSKARYLLDAETIKDKAVFSGGMVSSSTFSANVDAYTEVGTRTSFPAMSRTRYHHSSTTIMDKGLFAGGTTSGTYFNEVDVYTSQGIKERFPPLSVGRYGLAASTVGQIALFGGGVGAGSQLDTMDAYDYQGVFTSFPVLSQARQGVVATTAFGNAFFGGGGTASTVYHDTVESYTADGFHEILPSLSEKKGILAATSLENKAIFGGGLKDNAASSIVEAYGSLDYTEISVHGGGIYNFGDGDHIVEGTIIQSNSSQIVVKKPVNGYIKYKGAIFSG